MSAVHLLCVRHGLSTWNLERRWQGQADPPLSEAGRAGAAELAASIHAVIGPHVRVWSSPLQRAASTAGIIAEHLGAGAVTLDERLREADIGPWQGLTSGEIEDGWPGFLASGQRPPGFEAEADLLARVVPALAAIATAAGNGPVPVVVAHAGVLRAVRRHGGAVDEHLANLGGLWFAVEPGDGTVTFTGVFDPGRRAATADESRL